MSALALLLCCTLLACCSALPQLPGFDESPFAAVASLRTQKSKQSNALTVDLGYGIYQGVADSTSNLTTWKGIRFAAPPTGSRRWQKPLVPDTNRTKVISADAYGPNCPQTPSYNGDPPEGGVSGDEDCLFLNVVSPSTSGAALPVFVWIHGGGYATGGGQQDLNTLINENNNSFIGVTIQYRLGAFGFLSSQEVFDNGVTNAGIYDQVFALQWLQQYASLFGGDPTRVTIAGSSAGAGSVMLLDIAYGGALGDRLFKNSIAASPFSPTQYSYDDSVPTSYYDAFVKLAGCSSYAGRKFDCLTAAPTATLQNASVFVSGNGPFGIWTFQPVTDGTLIQDLPSRQLAAGKVNGRYVLTGHSAVDGSFFLPKNFTTEADVASWMRITFPALSNLDIAAALVEYAMKDTSITATSPRFATNGLTGPSANELSLESFGQHQRAINIYSEITFACPSYWLAEAYTKASASSAGFKYQFSVLPGVHGQDLLPVFYGPAIPHGADLVLAFKRIYGNFINTGNPSISNLIANGQSTRDERSNPVSVWPVFGKKTWPMVNLNESFNGTIDVWGSVRPATGLKNDFTLVDAYTWEAGRGRRCDFWRSLDARKPPR